MILIVSFAGNEHVEEVRRHLTAPHTVLDMAWFPTRLGLASWAGDGGSRIQLRDPAGETIDLADVGAVWYRRIRPFEPAAELTDPTSRLFAWSESSEALLGVWYTLSCFWMNPPLGDEAAQRKVHQLRIAEAVGLSVPETLVTNEPERAREFVERHGPGQVVRKAFRILEEAPRETALVNRSDLALIDSVRYAPVIFQRFVPAVEDLRVTVVDGEVLAARIRTDPGHGVDYRAGLETAAVEATSLPDEVCERLLALMSRLGISFGAIDLRLTPEGEYVFLEVNPAGEYLFVSRRTGLPIPEAIAAALQRHDAEHQATRA
ncbi:MAG TPA: hypothetical protein VFY48_00660 [Solirubrobacterales bacterium]|nr:hypothetical protein [Solirubrobacterales bacterium]